MHVDKYQLKSAEEFTRFEFISEGPKGAIRKLIEFQPTTDPETYNLAFGDKHPSTGGIDDLAVSDNGDTEKVLATVAAVLLLTFMHRAVPKPAHGFTGWASTASTKTCNGTFTSMVASAKIS